jgi:hypothetical protein
MSWQRGWISFVGFAGVLVLAGAAAGQCGPAPGGGVPSTSTTSTTASSGPPTTIPITSGKPIGPEQHFLGLVNGTSKDATIYVVCPGPISGSRTGPPAGNQSVSVTQVAAGGGDTGSQGHELWAQFAADRLHFVAFGSYDSPMTLPATLQLPCGGTGTVDFSPCFDTLPCAVDSVDYVMNVTFVDIAA